MTLQQAFEAALSRFDGENFARLSEADRLLVTIWGLEADVNNGGFDQYYFNSSGDQARHAPVALRLIGAETMATLVEQSNGKFGPTGPPEDRDARQRALEEIRRLDDNAWDELDRKFFSYPDDISGLLVEHLSLCRVA